MRIAVVSTCAVAVPPAAYGGTELFVDVLVRALVARGHEVVVYATGDSRPAGALRACVPRPVWPPDYEAERRHAAFARHDVERIGADVVHLNSPDALLEFAGCRLPLVVTLHHQREESLMPAYRSCRDAALVAISRRQAATLPELGPFHVVHHGLEPERHPAGPGHGGYVAFLGRIGPQKAPHLAIDAARRAGVPLVIGGPHWPGNPRYDAYFEREMAPRLAEGGAVAWPGELDHRAKLRLLQRAEALLFPMDWEEPFGLAMIEAMLVGTPVVAFDRGSAREIVSEGVTGHLVEDVEGMAVALHSVRRLDRARCRERAVRRFSAVRMATDYERVYRAQVAAVHARMRGTWH